MRYRPRRVLVADDDFDVRAALLEVLEAEGYEARGVANGAEALLVLGHWRADLIVLDLLMPGMDGRAFLTEQGRVAGFAETPVLLISAQPDLAKATRGLSAVAVYEKPFSLDELLAAVRALTAPIIRH
jgi:two-component system response regulator MprA